MFFLFTLFVLICSQDRTISTRFGRPRLSESLYTRGYNYYYQAGYSGHTGPIEDEKKFLTNSVNLDFFMGVKKYKLMCHTQHNLFVVLSDNMIGVLGESRLLPGTQTSNYGNFQKISSEGILQPDENIIDMKCGREHMVIQTDYGHLYGYGYNENNAISDDSTNLKHGILVSMMNGDLATKQVRTFGIGRYYHNSYEYGGSVAVDIEGQIYYRGARWGGNCANGDSQGETSWVACNLGYSNFTIYGDLDIVTVSGAYGGFFFITHDLEYNRVFFVGDHVSSGSDLSTSTNGEVVYLNFASFNMGGELSELSGKLVVDIQCIVNNVGCIALDTDGSIYTWGDLRTNQHWLGRVDHTAYSAKVAKKIDHQTYCDSEALVQYISAHYETICFICTDNRAFCSGDNYYSTISSEISINFYDTPKRTTMLDIEIFVNYYRWIASGYGRTLYFFHDASNVVIINLLIVFCAFFMLI